MTIIDAQSQNQFIVHDSKNAGLSSRPSTLQYTKSDVYTQGTGNNQINQQFNDQRTLSASANETLDLNGTALQDDFGDNLALTKIKELFIENTSATGTLTITAVANGVVLGQDFSANSYVIPVKGTFHIKHPVGGWTVTPGTGDLLKLVNGDSGNPLTYNIIILGVK